MQESSLLLQNKGRPATMLQSCEDKVTAFQATSADVNGFGWIEGATSDLLEQIFAQLRERNEMHPHPELCRDALTSRG